MTLTEHEDAALPTRVAAKEFARKIGPYQRLALTRPITITTHGHPSLVVLNVAEYERLKRRDREVLDLKTLTDEQASELLQALEASRPAVASDEHDHELDGWTP